MLPFQGATKNGASMRRGPDCLSGLQTTAEIFSLDAIARAKIGLNRPIAATVFIDNGAPPLSRDTERLKTKEAGNPPGAQSNCEPPCVIVLCV